MNDVKIKRALLSVSDKTGLADLGRALAAHGVELVSTGGTAAALRDAGLAVMDISDLTGFPEMMDGRVKTLHPKVHGGLLAVRDDPAHAASMAEHAIGAIDLVVVNLYPFAATVAKGAGRDEVIENIDIGGPSMVRSAAKNHRYVTIVTDPADYPALITALDETDGATTPGMRKAMAAKAYAATAAYDAAIAQWFAVTDQQQHGHGKRQCHIAHDRNELRIADITRDLHHAFQITRLAVLQRSGQCRRRHGRLLGGHGKAEHVNQQKPQRIVEAKQNALGQRWQMQQGELHLDHGHAGNDHPATGGRTQHCPPRRPVTGNIVFALATGMVGHIARHQAQILADKSANMIARRHPAH